MITVGRWYVIVCVILSLAVGMFVGEFVASKQHAAVVQDRNYWEDRAREKGIGR